jgi:hypothetical protein
LSGGAGCCAVVFLRAPHALPPSRCLQEPKPGEAKAAGAGSGETKAEVGTWALIGSKLTPECSPGQKPKKKDKKEKEAAPAEAEAAAGEAAAEPSAVRPIARVDG